LDRAFHPRTRTQAVDWASRPVSGHADGSVLLPVKLDLGPCCRLGTERAHPPPARCRRTAHLRRPPEGRIQPQAGQICRRRAGSRRLAGYCDMQQPPVLWGPVCSVSAPPPPEHCGRARGSRDWSSPAPRLRRPCVRAGARSQRRSPHMNQASDLVDAAIFFHRGHHAWLRVSPPPQPAATFPTVVPPSVPICLHHASRPLCRRQRRP